MSSAINLSYMVASLVYAMTQEVLANKIGKKQSTVANKLRILKLSPAVKKIIKENNLTERHARALLKLHDEDLQIRLLKKICDKNLNVNQTEKEIDQTIESITNPCQKNVSIKKISSQKIKSINGLKDIRIFINTVKQAVEYIRKEGVLVHFDEKNDESFIEYTIRIAK